MKYYMLIYLTLTFHIALGQDLSVPLKKIVGSSKVGGAIYGLNQIADSVSQKHYNVTADDMSLYYTTLSASRDSEYYLKDSLFVLIHTDSSGNKTVNFDTDFDRDFSNNPQYRFKSGIDYDPIIFVRQRMVIDADTIINYLPYSFRAFDTRVMINKKVQPVTLTESWSEIGEFQLKNHLYTVNVKERRLNRKNLPEIDLIVRSSSDTLHIANRNKIGDTVLVGNHRYQVSKQADILHFVFIDSLKLDLAKDFQRKDFITREAISLSQLSDKYVLLDFWGSWCGPCVEGIPRLKNIAERYREHMNLISVAFEKDANLSKLKSLIRENDMDWYHVRENWEFNNPLNLTKLYYVQVYPTFILIDKSGKIVFREEGNEGIEILESKLQNMFGKISR